MKKLLLLIAMLALGYISATIVSTTKIFTTMSFTRLANFYFLGIIPLILTIGLCAYILVIYKQLFKKQESITQEPQNKAAENNSDTTNNKEIEPFDMEKYQSMKSKIIEEISNNPIKAAEKLEAYVKGQEL